MRRRPALLRNFFETDKESSYLGERFIGRLIDKEIREKIYWKNAEILFGQPKEINLTYLLKTAERLQGTKQKSVWADKDLQYIIDDIKNIRIGE